MLHEGLGLADGVGHLLHRLGHLSWGQQKFGDVHGGIGEQGSFGRRLQDGGWSWGRGLLQPCRGGLHRDLLENVAIGLQQGQNRLGTANSL